MACGDDVSFGAISQKHLSGIFSRRLGLIDVFVTERGREDIALFQSDDAGWGRTHGRRETQQQGSERTLFADELWASRNAAFCILDLPFGHDS